MHAGYAGDHGDCKQEAEQHRYFDLALAVDPIAIPIESMGIGPYCRGEGR